MAQQRKKYSPEYKDEAVKMVLESDGRSIAAVARDLGINSGTLTNWVAAYRKKHPDEEEPLAISERARLRELERENRELRMKAEFLEKAALDSTGQGNAFDGGAVAEAFTWAVIEPIGDGVELGLSECREISFLGEVLA